MLLVYLCWSVALPFFCIGFDGMLNYVFFFRDYLMSSEGPLNGDLLSLWEKKGVNTVKRGFFSYIASYRN